MARKKHDDETETAVETKSYLILTDGTVIDGKSYSINDVVELDEETAVRHRNAGVPLGEAP